MNCTLCQRKLKNPTATGMGKTCQKKFHSQPDAQKEKTIRVEPLFVRRQPRRSYLVFTSPRQTVVVNETETGERFARCGCSEGITCEHIQIVAEIDRARFPEDLAAAVEVEAVKENLTAQTVENEPLMICLNDRQAEFKESLSRAAKSNLIVFPDFERDSFVIVNTDTKSEYRAIFKSVAGRALASCDCGDFKHRGRICKHLSRVLQDFLCEILAKFSAKNSAAEVTA